MLPPRLFWKGASSHRLRGQVKEAAKGQVETLTAERDAAKEQAAAAEQLAESLKQRASDAEAREVAALESSVAGDGDAAAAVMNAKVKDRPHLSLLWTPPFLSLVVQG